MPEPIPPQVAAEAGPNNIQAPNAAATKLVVKDSTPTFLPAVDNLTDLDVFLNIKFQLMQIINLLQ